MNTLVALCALGAERILGNEIKHLGLHLTGGERNSPGRVTFTGDDDAPLLANLSLRTADRVLLQTASCRTETFDDLFDCIYLVEWEGFFRKDCRVVVDKVRSRHSMLESARSVQAVAQKAIYTRLGDKWHIATLPETGDTYNVRIYIEDDVATVLLDLSGEPLHKRGYRPGGGAAPLRETTASALLKEMLWRRKTPLLDPFCGAGTIAAEAALYAYDVAPGLGRSFALETFANHNSRRMKDLRQQLAGFIRTDVEVNIAASDIDGNAVQNARVNVERALSQAGKALQSIGRDDKIPRPVIMQKNALEITASDVFPRLAGGSLERTEYYGGGGLILTNPPYGERLGTPETAEELYKNMAVMRSHFPDWQFGIFTDCASFPQYFGKEATLAKGIKAGNLETMLYVYDDARQTKNGHRGNKIGGTRAAQGRDIKGKDVQERHNFRYGGCYERG